MPQNDLYIEFLKKLKKDKSEKEVTEFLTNFLKFGAEEIYYITMMYLTDQDFEDLEKIDDQDKMQEEIKTKFKLRVGVSAEEFIQNLRDTIAKEYLFPQLNTPPPTSK